MPPIYRHVVPNVPAWTAGNGSPCYRGDKPSCQKQMEFRATWSGDVATPYGTITGAEINAAIGAADWSDHPFVYGSEDMNTMATPGVSAYNEYPIRVADFGSKEIDLTFYVGLLWAADKNYWQWVIEMRRLHAYIDPSYFTVCTTTNVGRFESSATTQKVRLGNGTVLNYKGMIYPETDPDLVWRNTACSGCSITLSAQYA